MKLKKYALFLIISIIAIPMAFAEITISLPQKDIYSLGEKITPEISIKESQDYNGFFKLNLVCDNYDMQYFAIPLSVEAESRRVVEAAELTLFEPIIGECTIKAAFDGNDGSHIDSESSDDFEVMNTLKIATNESLEGNPGEDVLIVADISKASGEPFSGEVETDFNGQLSKAEADSGRLEQMITIPLDMEAGEKAVLVRASDKFGNKGEVTVMLNVPQIPTSIENKLTNDVLIPGEELRASITLYDHIGKPIEGSSINVKVFSPEESQLAESQVVSGSTFSFLTYNTLGPGAYFLLSSFENVRQQSTFTITQVRKISMREEGSMVYIENTGNVDYEDKVTIVLEGEEESYLVNRKIELKPGERMTIDLSKEVPTGTYDITLPEAAFEEPENESLSEEFGPANLVQDVRIEDSRGIAKKSMDGVSSVTGAAISTAKVIASKPTLASIILITIILGITAYYGRGFITGKVRKKDDGKLFKDFKYSKEEEEKK